jgi:hypothetical protein
MVYEKIKYITSKKFLVNHPLHVLYEMLKAEHHV